MAAADLQLEIKANAQGLITALGEAANETRNATAQIRQSTSEMASGFEASAAEVRESLTGVSAGMAEAAETVAADSASIRESLEQVKATAEAAKLPFDALSAVIEIGAVVEPINRLKESLLQLGHASEATGVTVQKLDELKLALSSLGVEMPNFGQTMARLAEHMMIAREGSKEEALAFEQLGISAKQLENPSLDVVQVMMDIARHLQKSGDYTNDLASAYLLLGRGSDTLVASLREGSSALQEQMQSFSGAANAAAAGVKSADELQAAETRLSAAATPALVFAFRGLVDVLKFVEASWDATIGELDIGVDEVIPRVIGIVDALHDVGAAASALVHGQWDEAMAEIKSTVSAVQIGAAQARTQALADAKATAAEIRAIFAEAPEEKKPPAPTLSPIHTKEKKHKTNAAEFAHEHNVVMRAAAEEIEKYNREQDRLLSVSTAQFVAANRTQMQATRAAFTDERGAVEEYYRERQKLLAADLSSQIKAIGEAGKLHRISPQEELAETQALYRQQHDSLVTFLNEQLAMLDQSDARYLTEKQKLSSEIADADAKLQAQLQAAQGKSEQEQEQRAKRIADAISRPMDKAMEGVMLGTQRIGVAFRRMGEDMVASFAEAMEKVVVQFVVSHTIMRAVGAQTAVTQISQDAAKAAAGAYSAVVGIPFVGPVLAPIAAGVAYAGVEAFGALSSAAGGQWEVPGEQMTLLHPREMVLPAAHADALRQTVAGGGASGTTMHFHFAPTVHAVDADGVESMLRNHAPKFAGAVSRHLRARNAS